MIILFTFDKLFLISHEFSDQPADFLTNFSFYIINYIALIV